SERQDPLVAAQPLAKGAQEPLHLRAHFIRCAPKAAVLVPVGVIVPRLGVQHSGGVDAHRSTTEKRVLESGQEALLLRSARWHNWRRLRSRQSLFAIGGK